MMYRAEELKAQATVMHLEASHLPAGEAAALRKVADGVWERGENLHQLALLELAA